MKRGWGFGALAILTLALAGCTAGNEQATTENTEVSQQETTTVSAEETTKSTTQTISYLGKDYTVPTQVNSIVAASLEAMEDAAILGIKPAGVLQIGGEIPTYIADDLAGAELIGDKREPNPESILALQPDVIVGTSKWGEEVVEKMNKIQTMIPYSHISTNWKENLTVLAQLGGKEAEAEKIIADYETKVADAQSLATKQLVDKEILIIRIRGGLMYIYPQDVYLNPVLYEDLGASVPEIIAKTEAQAEITLETLAEVNPDAIFLQFETSENAEAPKSLEELQSNPIFANLAATKASQVYVNSIDPLAQGGTAWSKVKFLDAAYENLFQ